MNPKRVYCDQCKNFTEPKFSAAELDKTGVIKKGFRQLEGAKCSEGKRVMFRMPIFLYETSYNSINDYGWIRYCNEFKPIKDV